MTSNEEIREGLRQLGAAVDAERAQRQGELVRDAADVIIAWGREEIENWGQGRRARSARTASTMAPLPSISQAVGQLGEMGAAVSRSLQPRERPRN